MTNVNLVNALVQIVLICSQSLVAIRQRRHVETKWCVLTVECYYMASIV